MFEDCRHGQSSLGARIINVVAPAGEPASAGPVHFDL